eukprot:4409872-Amphidinium_carterae.1
MRKTFSSLHGESKFTLVHYLVYLWTISVDFPSISWGMESHRPYFAAARAFVFAAGWVTSECKYEADTNWKSDPVRINQYVVMQMLIDSVLAIRKDGKLVAVRFPKSEQNTE